MLGDILPVSEAEHLDGVEEPRVLPHVPVAHQLGLVLVLLHQQARPSSALVLQDGGLGKYGKVSIV